MNDETEYRHYYEKAVQFLVQEFKNIPIFIVLTTSVQKEEREKRVKIRNNVAIQIAKQYNLPIIDLYTVSSEFSELRSADGVHFSRDGYIKFADQILSDISNI